MFCALGYMSLSSIVVRQVELKLRYGQRHKKIVSTKSRLVENVVDEKLNGKAYHKQFWMQQQFKGNIFKL